MLRLVGQRLAARGRGRARAGAGGKSVVPAAASDPWQEVKDPNSGQTYWWNEQTNETTAVGALKPSADPWQEARCATTGQVSYSFNIKQFDRLATSRIDWHTDKFMMMCDLTCLI